MYIKEFVKNNPTFRKYEKNVTANTILYIVSEMTNVAAMVKLSKEGKPALAACAETIESFVERSKDPALDLSDRFVRNMVGRMVSEVMALYGYRACGQKALPRSNKLKYFVSGSCYCYDDEDYGYNVVIDGDSAMEMQCGEEVFDYLHLVTTVSFGTTDDYHTTSVTIGGKTYPLSLPYAYRSQGNVHLLFWSESNKWFAVSYDGHKGQTYYNRNPLINYLALQLNKTGATCNGYIEAVDTDKIFGILKSYSVDYDAAVSENDKIKIYDGSQFDLLNFFAVRSKNEVDHFDSLYKYFEYGKNSFCVEETAYPSLQYFLEKHFDKTIAYPYSREEEAFDCYQPNLYTPDSLKIMLADVRFVRDILKRDYTDVRIKDYLHNSYFSAGGMLLPELEIKRRLPIVVDFYNRFCEKAEELLANIPDGYDYVSIEGELV